MPVGITYGCAAIPEYVLASVIDLKVDFIICPNHRPYPVYGELVCILD